MTSNWENSYSKLKNEAHFCRNDFRLAWTTRRRAALWRCSKEIEDWRATYWRFHRKSYWFIPFQDCVLWVRNNTRLGLIFCAKIPLLDAWRRRKNYGLWRPTSPYLFKLQKTYSLRGSAVVEESSTFCKNRWHNLKTKKPLWYSIHRKKWVCEDYHWGSQF